MQEENGGFELTTDPRFGYNGADELRGNLATRGRLRFSVEVMNTGIRCRDALVSGNFFENSPCKLQKGGFHVCTIHRASFKMFNLKSVS